MTTTVRKLAYTLVLGMAILLSPAFSEAQRKKQSVDDLNAEIENLKKELEDATKRASLAEENAKRSSAIAVQAQAMAEKAEAAANRARYIAQAKMMAIKSFELEADPEQEALVAQQAYRFNNKYRGNPWDDDIYSGLYNALTHFNDPVTKSLDSPAAIMTVVTSAKSSEIFSGDKGGAILRWTRNDDEWKSDLICTRRKGYEVNAMDISQDGNWLIAGLSVNVKPVENHLEVYDLKNPQRKPIRISGFGKILKLIYSPGGGGAFVLEGDGARIKFTDFKTVQEVIKSKEKIHEIAISSDGRKLSGASASGALYVWDISNNYAERVIYKNTSDITSVVFAPDNRRIVFGDEEGHVRIIFEDSNLAPRMLTGHTAYIEKIVFNNAGTFMATTSRDHSIRIWNWLRITDPPIVFKAEKETVWTSGAAFTPNDDQLMIGVVNATSQKKMIRTWPTTSEPMSTLLCGYINRNMTKEEWANFVGEDLVYERTCDSFPANNK
jgi:WD domain, G-beta repeat